VTTQDKNDHLLRSVLILNNATPEDSGKYRCIYDNIQEQVEVKVHSRRFFENSFLTGGGVESSFQFQFKYIKSILTIIFINILIN
jgi:hypothetical protein